MQYLAFDIECANQYVSGSMCSMGVVIADENFRVLHREDIIINPKCRIFDKHCKLVYEPSVYNTAEHFAQVYPRLKGLLEADNTVVIGHAVGNDVRFLEQALKRYSLPAPSFKYVCTQHLYREFAKEQNSISVESAAEIMGLECLTSHKAEDDAFVSLMLLKYLTEQTGMSLGEMLDRYKIIMGEFSESGHVRHFSAQRNKNELFLRAVQDSPKLPKNKKERRKIVKFCFDPIVWLTDVDLARDMLYSQFEQGWVYQNDFSGLTYYVVQDNSTSTRLKKIELHNQNGGSIEVIPLSALNRTITNSYSSDPDTLRTLSI